MFAVGVVMLSYLAGKALIYRELFCEWVPFCLLRMTTGACSQHIVSYIFKECFNIQIDLLYNILYNLY